MKFRSVPQLRSDRSMLSMCPCGATSSSATWSANCKLSRCVHVSLKGRTTFKHTSRGMWSMIDIYWAINIEKVWSLVVRNRRDICNSRVQQLQRTWAYGKAEKDLLQHRCRTTTFTVTVSQSITSKDCYGYLLSPHVAACTAALMKHIWTEIAQWHQDNREAMLTVMCASNAPRKCS